MNHLLRKINKFNTKEEKYIILTWSRAYTIIPLLSIMENNIYLLYNRLYSRL